MEGVLDTDKKLDHFDSQINLYSHRALMASHCLEDKTVVREARGSSKSAEAARMS